MIAILAPARNVRAVDGSPVEATRPLFMQRTMQLVEALRAYSPWQLESLLDVPPQRAFALYDAYQVFDETRQGSVALLAYYGAAYRNMALEDFTRADLAFAQKHLRILSALYGMLRPLDGILEHRLGMKKDFRPYGKDLYVFWGDRLYKELYKDGDVVVNIASVEYAKLILPHMQPGDTMITCRFLVQKRGKTAATVSTVRAARGLMARFILKNRVKQPEDLKDFAAEGYEYIPSRSNEREYVFVQSKMR